MDKINQENINRPVVENEDEIDINKEEDSAIYPMNSIQVDKGFYTAYELKRRYDAEPKRIILDSDFQREDVWDNIRKAELIESILMGLPLPVFYFNQDKYGRLIVVDGRQRLTALFEFMNNKYKLKKLKILKEHNEKLFTELSPVLQARIEDYQIQAHVIMPPTPDRIKFDIFDRVNRGGMQLNKQEIRNALYQGHATQFLKRIVEKNIFTLATGNAFLHEKRMKDKYLITRFLAIYMYLNNYILDDSGNIYEYRGDIDDLLGRTMERINRMENAELTELENVVTNALEKSYFYLGEDAYRLRRNVKRTPINMNVFETVMYIMTFVRLESEKCKMLVQDTVFKLVDSNDFRQNISSHRDGTLEWNWRISEAAAIGRILENDTKFAN